jgi:hypothetical protein
MGARSWNVEYFHEPNSSGVIYTLHDRGIGTGNEIRKHCGLHGISWGQPKSVDCRFIRSIQPIIVGLDDVPISIVEF